MALKSSGYFHFYGLLVVATFHNNPTLPSYSNDKYKKYFHSKRK
jgi:hypothetical protein